ncbi:MAG: phospholipid carrier-dependent glycosyltransferase [Endomicrobiales bacterium]|nr:phospholipid carrier-dependent glycosyltransferase [Endomicrobiales bacterium]
MDMSRVPPSPEKHAVSFRDFIDRKDAVIMLILCIVYFVVALVNLGSFKTPQTFWRTTEKNENFEIDFGRPVKLSRLYYFWGIGPAFGNFRLRFHDGRKYVTHHIIENAPYPRHGPPVVLTWNYIPIFSETRKLKIVVNDPGTTLSEMVFFEEGSDYPLRNFKISKRFSVPKDEGRILNLFDEQHLVDYRHPEYFSGMFWDEIGVARSAIDYIDGGNPTDWMHPPLGKLLIAAGAVVFGKVPFGWRITGTLFGALMVAFLYVLAKALFRSRFLAFAAALLLSVDFMHFTQTRIGTADGFVPAFLVLSYLFMYLHMLQPKETCGWKYPLLSGVFLGCAAATKWMGAFAVPGLAAAFVAGEIRNFPVYFSKINRNTRVSSVFTVQMPAMLKHRLTKTFVIVFLSSFAVYSASYIMFFFGTGLSNVVVDFISLQSNMLKFHVGLVGPHPFASRWWQWPIIARPMLYFKTYWPSGAGDIVSMIISMGNPLIWWSGIITVPLTGWLAWKKKTLVPAVIFFGAMAQYAPWFYLKRMTYIYHFFSVVPFLILSVVYVFSVLEARWKRARLVFWVYLAAALLLFAMFYPGISGFAVPAKYMAWLKWFPTWDF